MYTKIYLIFTRPGNRIVSIVKKNVKRWISVSVVVGPIVARAVVHRGQLLFAQLFVVTAVDQSLVMADEIALVLYHQIELERDQDGEFVGNDLFSVVESKFSNDRID